VNGCAGAISPFYNVAGVAGKADDTDNYYDSRDPAIGGRLMTFWGVNITVTAEQFFQNPEHIAFTSQGITNNIVLGPEFFNPDQALLNSRGISATQFQAITLVHEVLHSYTGLGDVALARKLNLGSFNDDDGDKASDAIGKYLQTKCDLSKFK
jgi:hypothetical protein